MGEVAGSCRLFNFVCNRRPAKTQHIWKQPALSFVCYLAMLALAGCGASKASSAIAGVEDVEQQRDPEDYILDPIQLQVTKIEEFDEVFTHLGTLLNRLIELNNNVHLAVGAVKAAYAPLAGGFELLVSLAPSTDVVLLDIHASRVNTSRPAPETLQRLVLSQPAVKEAAAELEAARTQLHDFLAESEDRIGLLVGKDGGIALEEHGEVPQQVQHFNTCMAKLQGLLSTHGHLTASVKPTASHGTKTIRAQLYRRSPGEVEADLKPVSVVDVCTSQQGARIKQAEAFLADRAQHLAQRIKGMDLEWEVVSGYFLVLMSELPNPDVQQHVGKLLQAINIALFKLLNAGASAATPASLTHAVLELVRPVCTALQNRHDNLLAYNLKVSGWWGRGRMEVGKERNMQYGSSRSCHLRWWCWLPDSTTLVFAADSPPAPLS